MTKKITKEEENIFDYVQTQLEDEESEIETEVTNSDNDKYEEEGKFDKIDFISMSDKDFRKFVKRHPLTNRQEAINLVRLYYQLQKQRIGSSNRKFQIEEGNSQKNEDKNERSAPFSVMVNYQLKAEKRIALWMEEYAKNHPVGKWLLTVTGIGPVTATGLLSYIDMSKAKAVGAIWHYAGIDKHYGPKRKGEKLNYNPDFKVLCWKIGESFAKVSGYKKIKVKDENGKVISEEIALDEYGEPIFRSPNAYYGKILRKKYEYYQQKNAAGGFKEAAALALSEKNFKDNTEAKKAYESGKLPEAHIMAMAKRYATKIFLANLFKVWYEYENGIPAPRPYPEVFLGHVHMFEPQNTEVVYK